MDIAKARNVLDHIRKYPEQHDQTTWVGGDVMTVAADNGDHPSCGTAMCFAGWAGFLYAPKGSCLRGGMIRYPERRAEHVNEFAPRELGLTEDQAEMLFSAGNSLADLEAMVDCVEADPDANMWDLSRAIYDRRVLADEAAPIA